MGIMFSLTDAGRRVHDQPRLYPQYGADGLALLAAIQAHDAGLSFEDIIQSVPGEMFRVLQLMATGMAAGLLSTDAPRSRDEPDKDRGHP